MAKQHSLIEDLLDLQIPGNIRISPDRRQVIYSTTAVNDNVQCGEHPCSIIWLAEVGQPNSARRLTSGRANDRLPRWHPNGQYIGFVSDRAERGVSCAIYWTFESTSSVDMALTFVRHQSNIERFEFCPRGKYIAFLSADEQTPEQIRREKAKEDARVWGEDWKFNRLRLVNLVSLEDVSSVLVKGEFHVLDFVWNQEGTKLAFTHTENPTIESTAIFGYTLSIVEVSSGCVQEVGRFTTRVRTGLAWVGESLYFGASARTDSAVSSNVVYEVRLSEQTLAIRKVPHDQEVCTSGLAASKQFLFCQELRGMEDSIRIFQGPTLFQVRKKIVAYDVAIGTTAEDVVLVIAYGDTDSPTEVFSIETTAKNRTTRLSTHGHLLTNCRFGSANFLSCQSTDDKETLEALYLKPHKSVELPESPLPTAVLIHGGPYDRCTEGFNPLFMMWTPLILSLGYGVLLPNYRGSSGRGARFAEYARGSCGEEDYADIITLTEHAIALGHADKEKLIVGGWSQGGFLSYLCAVRNGQSTYGWKFRGAIPGAGVTDWDSLSLGSDLGTIEAEYAGVAPWNAAKDDIFGRSGSPMWELKAAIEKGVSFPAFLILHGELDRRVPVQQSTGFVRALQVARVPFRLVTYPREEHTFRERAHLADMLHRIAAFCNTHLG